MSRVPSMIKGKIIEILPALKSGFISSGMSEDVFFSPVTVLIQFG